MAAILGEVDTDGGPPLAIPLAVAGLLNPLVAAVAMATSSLLVVGNSTRSIAD